MMSTGRSPLKVEKIENGVVIDGLLANSSIPALKLLGIKCDTPLTPIEYIVIPLMNIKSERLKRRKDILKIEVEQGNDLDGLIKHVEAHSGYLALIGPGIKISEIRNWAVVNEYTPAVPEEVIGVVNCPRYNCVTHEPKPAGSNDHYQPWFHVVQPDPLILKCHYCPTQLTNSAIIENLVLK